MKIRNLYNEILDPMKEYKDVNPLAPKWPFRMLIHGPSGVGKTNMVCCLLLDYLYFDHIIILASQVHRDPLYEYVINQIEDINELVEMKQQLLDSGEYEDIDTINIDMSLIPDEPIIVDVFDYLLDPIDLVDPDKQNLLIIDDMIQKNSKEQSDIIGTYIYGRKHGISSIYISQDYFKVPDPIRKNCNYIAVFKCNSTIEMRNIILDNTLIKPYEELKVYFEENNNRPNHEFLLLDKENSDPYKKIRCGFDQSYIL